MAELALWSVLLALAPWVSEATLAQYSYLEQTTGVGAYYGKTDENEAMKALSYAADRGMTFWDTANIYGTCNSLALDLGTESFRY